MAIKLGKGASPHSKSIFLLVVHLVSSANMIRGTLCQSLFSNSYLELV